MSAAALQELRLYLAAHPVAYPLLRMVARAGPAVRVPGVGVVVSDATLARAVLGDPERFRKDGPGSSGALWTPVLGPSVLLNMEGEAHRVLRRKLAGLLTPASAGQLCERVLTPELDRLRARLTAGERVDLVGVMRVAAGSVACALTGTRSPADPAAAARAHRERFAKGEEVVAMVRLTTRALPPAKVARARAVLAEVTADAARAWRDADPATVPGRMRALGLTEREAVGAAGAFFLTATETVASLVPRLIALLADSGQLDRVAGDRALLPAAVEEALRVTTPSPAMLRSVAAEGEVGGVRVRPGDRVVIATASCARLPGGFDLDRPAQPALRHLWFGSGPHFCIGYPLAVAETIAVANAVLDCAPLRVTARRPARGVLIPTWRTLEIQVAGGRRAGSGLPGRHDRRTRGATAADAGRPA